MRWALAILIFPLIFAGCASTSPRGQIVKMHPLEAKGSSVKQEVVSSPFFQQLPESNTLTPSSKEDAAIFHFSLGQAYSLDNDPQRAMESYRTTLLYDPKSALVHARLAAELVKVGGFAEAKTLCEKAIQLDPKYVDSYLLLAGIQVAAKEYSAALATYKKSLEYDPKNRDALLYYGITLAEVGKTGEGIAQLQKLVKLKDTDESNIDQSVAYYYLAKIYHQANQKDAAMGALQESLKRRPGFSKAALALADLHLERKEEKRARAVLETTFREDHKMDLAERLADLHLEKNDYRGAVVYLETLVEEDPTNENMRLRLALVYWQIQWHDKAKKILLDLHSRFPASSEISFYLGELEMEQKNISAAIGYYQKIQPDYPKYEQMVGRVVNLYRQEKQFERAEDFVQEALRKRADLVAFYPLLAAIYEDQGKLEDAKLALERGLKRFDRDENILYYLGFLYDRLGDRENGLALMQKLLEVNPDNANALNFVGFILLEQGVDPKTAAPYIERALALRPDDGFVLDSYGWLLYRRKKYPEALKRLEKAFALKPEEGVIAEHLADVYLASGMPHKAVAFYEEALTLGGDKEFEARVANKLQNVQEVLAANDRPSAIPATERNPASSP